LKEPDASIFRAEEAGGSTKLHSITFQKTVTLIFIANRKAKLLAHILKMVAEPQRVSHIRHSCVNTPWVVGQSPR
jgi:hypothetical protein